MLNRAWWAFSVLWFWLVVWSYSSAGNMPGHWWFAVLPLLIGALGKLAYRFIRFGSLTGR